MAKGSKLFRLSEEAIAILDTKPNASRFVEDLILKQSENISRGETMILDRLNDIHGEGKKTSLFGLDLQTEGQLVREPKTITKPEAMERINDLNYERDRSLEYCQDPDEIKRIGKEYQLAIDLAWVEYRNAA
jgi:hypothetical protein